MREYTRGDAFLPRSVFPELAIEMVVECAIDLEERVEVAVTETAVVISEVFYDLEEGLGRKTRGREIRVRHRGGVGVGVVEKYLYVPHFLKRKRLGKVTQPLWSCPPPPSGCQTRDLCGRYFPPVGADHWNER
jgi:hypothetical protein